VDDDPSVRSALAQVLAEEGYTVICGANGDEALKTVDATIDLVLLDLNMPVRNGWDTFEQLTTRNPMLPVIIITARPNQLFTALSAGVGALMEKPLDFPELLEAIRSLLSEPDDVRIARIAGKRTEFRYSPAHQVS
jgi:two-component system response regulator CpxR